MQPDQIGRRTPVDLGVVGDVRAALEALVPLIKNKRDRTHLDRATLLVCGTAEHGRARYRVPHFMFVVGRIHDEGVVGDAELFALSKMDLQRAPA